MTDGGEEDLDADVLFGEGRELLLTGGQGLRVDDELGGYLCH